VQERLEVCVGGRVTLVGLNEHVRPAGETEEVKATAPANPLTPVTVIVEVAVLPWTIVTLVGLAASVKFVTMTVTVVVRD